MVGANIVWVKILILKTIDNLEHNFSKSISKNKSKLIFVDFGFLVENSNFNEFFPRSVTHCWQAFLYVIIIHLLGDNDTIFCFRTYDALSLIDGLNQPVNRYYGRRLSRMPIIMQLQYTRMFIFKYFQIIRGTRNGFVNKWITMTEHNEEWRRACATRPERA